MIAALSRRQWESPLTGKEVEHLHALGQFDRELRVAREIGGVLVGPILN